jgi:hypothetical protein
MISVGPLSVEILMIFIPVRARARGSSIWAKVLELSMGIGNFFSLMSADLKARSQLTGIELGETHRSET